MAGLVTLAGLLAIASGLLMVFGRGRTGGGVALLGLLEILAGVLGPVYVLTQKPPPNVGFLVLILTLALLLASSALQAMVARARRLQRVESEGSRLVTYVKFLSGKSQGGPGPTSKPPPPPGSG